MNFNIESIKRKMLVKYPFFGSVVENVNYKENREISTAGTDGQTIYYNPEFLKKLIPDEQTFIFAHEVCHIAFDHIKRSEGKDSKIWNVATDGVINQFLKRDGLKIVVGGIDIKEAINYDAEQLYDKLLKEKQESQNGQGIQQNLQDSSSSEQVEQCKGQSSSNESQQQSKNQSQEQDTSLLESDSSIEQNYDVGHDTHSMWKDAVKKQKKAELKKKEESKSFQKRNEILQQVIDKISKMGERSAFNKNLEEKKKELESLKQILSKQVMGAGKSTNRNQIILTDIGKSKPIIDWRYVLREAIQYDVDWSYRNASVEDGVVSANLEEQAMPETEIVLDTSGSIDKLLLKNFLRECKNILQHSKVKAGCFDTEFYGFQEIRTLEDIENMKFIGGGGTDFNVAVRAFTKRVENKIIFTDGNASVPDILMNAIWIVYGETKINPKGGKVIQIDNEQLDRLYSHEQNLSYKRKNR